MIAQVFPGDLYTRIREIRAFPALLLLLVLAGCGPIMIPRHPPLPYPEGLRSYLSEPWLDREGVHAALGPPALLRMEGDLELYVARREVAVELIMRTRSYDTHYLLLRYGDQGRVLWQGEIVNAGCVPAGVCVNRLPDNTDSGFYGSSDPELIAVYADDETDRSAREAKPGHSQCIVYPEAGNGKRSGFPQLSIELPGRRPVLLPLSGFVVWNGGEQAHELRIKVQTGSRHEERRFDFDCTEDRPTYYRLAAEKSGAFVPRYSMQLERVDASTGAAAIGAKRLILSH